MITTMFLKFTVLPLPVPEPDVIEQRIRALKDDGRPMTSYMRNFRTTEGAFPLRLFTCNRLRLYQQPVTRSSFPVERSWAGRALRRLPHARQACVLLRKRLESFPGSFDLPSLCRSHIRTKGYPPSETRP